MNWSDRPSTDEHFYEPATARVGVSERFPYRDLIAEAPRLRVSRASGHSPGNLRRYRGCSRLRRAAPKRDARATRLRRIQRKVSRPVDGAASFARPHHAWPLHLRPGKRQ